MSIAPAAGIVPTKALPRHAPLNPSGRPRRQAAFFGPPSPRQTLGIHARSAPAGIVPANSPPCRGFGGATNGIAPPGGQTAGLTNPGPVHATEEARGLSSARFHRAWVFRPAL